MFNSSVGGLVRAPTAVAYSASKHAVTGMTKGAAALFDMNRAIAAIM
ncbi:SDR family NAD(P)-dependent oxidoreductase [Paenibacillus sp. D51F]